MESIDVKQHIILVLIGIILLILVPKSVVSWLIIIFPLFVISIGLHYRNQKIGFIGIFLYYIFSISQININTLASLDEIVIFSIIILFPSVILVNQIFQNSSLNECFKTISQRKKPISLTVITAVLFFVCFYFLVYLLGGSVFFISDVIQQQILFLIGFSILFFVPILLKNTSIKNEDVSL